MRLGTAEWADPATVEANYRYRDDADMVWLGRLENGAPVGYGDDRHVCVVSGTRGGKGTTSIINNLCLWPGSVIVVDPKGENATVTAARRGAGSPYCEGMGQAVHVLDPFGAAIVDDAYRSRFNPLDALDPDAEDSIDEAARLADAMVVVQNDSKDPFWDESARAMVKALLLHVLTAPEYEGRRTLVTVRLLIARGAWEDFAALRDSGDGTSVSAQGLLWTAVAGNEALGGVVAGLGDTFLGMLQSSPKQFDSVLQVANRNTEFLDSPAMRRCVEGSDFRLSDLKTKPGGVSLYLSLPQRYMATHYRWLRMMIALTLSQMEATRGRPATGHRVLMVLDEFAGLKRMEAIESAVAQIAGFGVKMLFVLQSLEQLKATYKDSWETFLANAGLKLFSSIEDHFSRDYIAKLIGETEVVRAARSESESLTDTEGTSESRSRSEGTSSSQGRTVSGGTSRSVSRSESTGVNFSQSSSSGVTTGESRRAGFFEAPDKHISKGTSSSWSHSQGHSRSWSVSESETETAGWSDSVTAGQSTTVSASSGTSSSRARGRTAGMAESVHKRALITPDEIGQRFARIDDPSSALYPGLALAVITGAPPVIVRRVNYFEDLQFIARFDPHPDHPAPAPQLLTVPADALLPYRTFWPTLSLERVAAPGAIVESGAAFARLTSPALMPLTAPVSGRLAMPAGQCPDALLTMLHYPAAAIGDPFADVATLCRKTRELLASKRTKRIALAILSFVLFAFGVRALGQRWAQGLPLAGGDWLLLTVFAAGGCAFGLKSSLTIDRALRSYPAHLKKNVPLHSVETRPYSTARLSTAAGPAAAGGESETVAAPDGSGPERPAQPAGWLATIHAHAHGRSLFANRRRQWAAPTGHKRPSSRFDDAPPAFTQRSRSWSRAPFSCSRVCCAFWRRRNSSRLARARASRSVCACCCP